MSLLLRYAPDDGSIDWTESLIQQYIVMNLRKSGACFAASLEGNRRSGAAIARAKREGLEAGEPDLRIYMDGGRCLFIELKRKGGVLTLVQKNRHKRLISLGFDVHVVWAKTPEDGWNKVRGVIDGQEGVC